MTDGTLNQKVSVAWVVYGSMFLEVVLGFVRNFNRVLGRGGRGEVERFVRLVNHEDVVQRGPKLAHMLVYVSI